MSVAGRKKTRSEHLGLEFVAWAGSRWQEKGTKESVVASYEDVADSLETSLALLLRAMGFGTYSRILQASSSPTEATDSVPVEDPYDVAVEEDPTVRKE